MAAALIAVGIALAVILAAAAVTLFIAAGKIMTLIRNTFWR